MSSQQNEQLQSATDHLEEQTDLGIPHEVSRGIGKMLVNGSNVVQEGTTTVRIDSVIIVCR